MPDGSFKELSLGMFKGKYVILVSPCDPLHLWAITHAPFRLRPSVRRSLHFGPSLPFGMHPPDRSTPLPQVMYPLDWTFVCPSGTLCFCFNDSVSLVDIRFTFSP